MDGEDLSTMIAKMVRLNARYNFTKCHSIILNATNCSCGMDIDSPNFVIDKVKARAYKLIQ